MPFTFSKYSGCGNDFILVDNRASFFEAHDAHFIQNLCCRRTGIGADGLILLEESPTCHFKMRIFNADGYEAEMCGNGIRCLIKFIEELGFREEKYTIETFLRPLDAWMDGNLVSVEMGAPFDLRWDLPLSLEEQNFLVHHINTGVPHLVLFVEDIENFDLKNIGPKLRHHPQFFPQGANINIVQMGTHEVRNRTYERGVEGETLACGTGCAAAAIAVSRMKERHSPILVTTRSQEKLEFTLNWQGDRVKELFMTGSAEKKFSGEWP